MVIPLPASNLLKQSAAAAATPCESENLDTFAMVSGKVIMQGPAAQSEVMFSLTLE